MPVTEIALIGICMVLNAFFSGMETGMISIHRLRLQHRVRQQSRNARIAASFLRDPSRLLSTTLVGTNLCVTVISTLTAGLAFRFGGKPAQLVAGTVMGILVLVFCEFIPKSWFHGRPIERCLPLMPLLRASSRVLRPIGWSVTHLTQWIDPKGSSNDLSQTPYMTREHLRNIAHDSARWGHLSALERLMIDRVLQLEMTTAAQIMTPLERIVCVRARDPAEAAFGPVRSHGHMRLPVRDAQDPAFVGVLNVFELFELKPDALRLPVKTYMRPPLFVPDTLRADDILPVLRRHRQPMALVRNTRQETIGLVTTEDVLNQVTGRLHEDPPAPRPAAPAAAPGRNAPDRAHDHHAQG